MTTAKAQPDPSFAPEGAQPALDPKIHGGLKRMALAAGALSFAIGAVVLVGWILDVPTLKSVMPHYISMKANTAIGIMALAAALVLQVAGHGKGLQRLATRGCCLLTLLIGGLTILEYVGGLNLGLDEFFVADPGGAGGRFLPGRLAPITALTFVLLGAAMPLLQTRSRRCHLTAHYLALLAFVLTFQALIGYACGISYTFGSAFYTQMAVHTALASVLLSLGILSARPDLGLMTLFAAGDSGGYLSRRLVITAILVPPLVAFIHLTGLRAGLYDADFGVLLRVLANCIFLTLMAWRTGIAVQRSEAKRKQSDDTSRLKSEFLANMSHEIRTPINGVIGMIGLLSETALADQQRAYVEDIKWSADSLLGLINDVLDFSKIEAGRMEIESADFDLDRLISDLGRSTSFQARRKGLDCIVRSTVQFDFLVRGDPGHLRQVLVNLLSNAIKFTETGAVELRFAVAQDDGDNFTLRFAVADTGIGIPPEAVGRLFQAFSQADASTTRRFGGTGLGLSICKRLVELMGGEITVASTAGVGSTFAFTVPLARGPKRVAPEIEDARAAGVAAGTGARILVAEDNLVNQRVALAVLLKLGHHAVVVANGLEAIEALRQTPFDLVLMDCQMPDMDGYAATAAIRGGAAAGRNDVPIIAMTANAVKGDRERCLASGMNDYVPKPFRIEDLVVVLARWLPSATAARSAAAMQPRGAVLPVVDRSMVDSVLAVSEAHGASLLRELVDSLTGLVPVQLAAIGAAIAAKDGAKLVFAAHRLKGAAGSLGAARCAGVCQIFEDMTEVGDDAPRTLERLATEVTAALVELERIVREHEAAAA